jgi:hypothetical protein
MNRSLLALALLVGACTVADPTSPAAVRVASLADSSIVEPPTISFSTSNVDVSRTNDSKVALYNAPTVTVRRGTKALPDSLTLSFAPNSGLTCADRSGIFATVASVRVAVTDSAVVTFPLAICPSIAGTYYSTTTAMLRASVTVDSLTYTATATVKIR